MEGFDEAEDAFYADESAPIGPEPSSSPQPTTLGQAALASVRQALSGSSACEVGAFSQGGLGRPPTWQELKIGLAQLWYSAKTLPERAAVFGMKFEERTSTSSKGPSRPMKVLSILAGEAEEYLNADAVQHVATLPGRLEVHHGLGDAEVQVGDVVSFRGLEVRVMEIREGQYYIRPLAGRHSHGMTCSARDIAPSGRVFVDEDHFAGMVTRFVEEIGCWCAVEEPEPWSETRFVTGPLFSIGPDAGSRVTEQENAIITAKVLSALAANRIVFSHKDRPMVPAECYPQVVGEAEHAGIGRRSLFATGWTRAACRECSVRGGIRRAHFGSEAAGTSSTHHNPSLIAERDTEREPIVVENLPIPVEGMGIEEQKRRLGVNVGADPTMESTINAVFGACVNTEQSCRGTGDVVVPRVRRLVSCYNDKFRPPFGSKDGKSSLIFKDCVAILDPRRVGGSGHIRFLSFRQPDCTVALKSAVRSTTMVGDYKHVVADPEGIDSARFGPYLFRGEGIDVGERPWAHSAHVRASRANNWPWASSREAQPWEFDGTGQVYDVVDSVVAFEALMSDQVATYFAETSSLQRWGTAQAMIFAAVSCYPHFAVSDAITKHAPTLRRGLIFLQGASGTGKSSFNNDVGSLNPENNILPSDEASKSAHVTATFVNKETGRGYRCVVFLDEGVDEVTGKPKIDQDTIKQTTETGGVTKIQVNEKNKDMRKIDASFTMQIAANNRVNLGEDEALARRSALFHFHYGVPDGERKEQRELWRGSAHYACMCAIAMDYLKQHLQTMENCIPRKVGALSDPEAHREVVEACNAYRSGARRCIRPTVATTFVIAAEAAPILIDGEMWSYEEGGASRMPVQEVYDAARAYNRSLTAEDGVDRVARSTFGTKRQFTQKLRQALVSVRGNMVAGFSRRVATDAASDGAVDGEDGVDPTTTQADPTTKPPAWMEEGDHLTQDRSARRLAREIAGTHGLRVMWGLSAAALTAVLERGVEGLVFFHHEPMLISYAIAVMGAQRRISHQIIHEIKQDDGEYVVRPAKEGRDAEAGPHATFVPDVSCALLEQLKSADGSVHAQHAFELVKACHGGLRFDGADQCRQVLDLELEVLGLLWRNCRRGTHTGPWAPDASLTEVVERYGPWNERRQEESEESEDAEAPDELAEPMAATAGEADPLPQQTPPSVESDDDESIYGDGGSEGGGAVYDGGVGGLGGAGDYYGDDGASSDEAEFDDEEPEPLGTPGALVTADRSPEGGGKRPRTA